MQPHIPVLTIHDQEQASAALLAETRQHVQEIQCRAFDGFQKRGEIVGDDLGDWLRAERELLWKPLSEMFENEYAVVLRVAAAGFNAASLHITASPHWVLVQGTDTHGHPGLEARLRFCEFGQRLFRSFELPSPIDPNSVSVTLDKGIIEIVARKARPAAQA